MGPLQAFFNEFHAIVVFFFNADYPTFIPCLYTQMIATFVGHPLIRSEWKCRTRRASIPGVSQMFL